MKAPQFSDLIDNYQKAPSDQKAIELLLKLKEAESKQR
jgi:hypothetical protein